MGAKTWMLVTAEGDVPDSLASNPQLDRDASFELARELFPDTDLVESGAGDLYYINPPDDEIFVGVFGDVKIVAAAEFGIDHPSKLPRNFLSSRGTTTLHAMHSVVDWFAFAHWVDGRLIRSLSLAPDSGVMEDIGEHLAFEKPYWNGDHPAVEDHEDDYAFVFHPLELGEEALLTFFGYQIEGFVENNVIAPESFQLLHFKRTPSRRWWQFWK